MEDIKNIFIKKKILIYGLGKSGLSSYYFLKKKNNLYLYDDDKKVIKNGRFWMVDGITIYVIIKL